MKKEKTDSKENNSWYGLSLIGLIILSIIFYEVFWDYDDEELEDLASCIEWCIGDVDLCTLSSWIYDEKRNAYISQYDYESCISDLESCIEDCKDT